MKTTTRSSFLQKRALFRNTIMAVLMYILFVSAANALSISFSAPTSGQTIAPNTNFTIKVNTSTDVVKVQYWVDNWSWLGETTTSPFNFNYNVNLTNGNHVFKARAFNASGATVDATEVSFTVGATATLPTVSFSAPTSGQNITQNTNFILKVNVNSSVTKVQYWYDNYNWIGETTTAPFDYTFNVNLSLGSHVFKARAYNANGDYANATDVSFNVISTTSSTGGSTKYEAENAQLTGTNIATEIGGYSGSSYVTGLDADGDKITFSVNVSTAGTYPLVIRYANSCGACEKVQLVKVNTGSDVQTSFNAASSGWSNLNFGNVNLNSGNNTITISKYWGWTNVDYITIGATGGSTPPPSGGSQENQNSPIGINLSDVRPYVWEMPFVNLAYSALPWMPVNGIAWENYLPATDLDANNYPKANKSGELPVYWDRTDAKTGNYVCTYQGSGTVTVHTNGNGTVNITSSTSGKIEFSVTNATFLFVRVQNGSTNPISNLKICEKRFDGTSDVFYPEFVNNWRKFKVFRFMDWMHTNWSSIKTWSDYANINTIAQKNICPELMVQLCNLVKADAWVCIPHQADNTFVTNFLTYFKNNLDPSLKLYVEHSNEVWNGQFCNKNSSGACQDVSITNTPISGQYTYAVQKGNAEGFTGYDWEKAGKWHARRSKQIFDVIDNVFSGEINRIVRVVSWQNGQGSFWQNLILNQDNLYTKTDAYATAPYFGNTLGTDNIAVSSVDDVFNKLPDILNSNKNDMSTDRSGLASNSNWSHITFITYEGGQHLVAQSSNSSNNTNYTNYFKQANRDSRMKSTYATYLNNWKTNGGKLFVHFSSAGEYSQYGSWGAKENPNATRANSPKYDALLTFIENNLVNWNVNNGKSFNWAAAREEAESISEFELNTLLVYPNPTEGEIQIKISPQYINMRLQIYNALGVELLNEIAKTENMKLILPKGIYYLKIGEKNNKIVVE